MKKIVLLIGAIVSMAMMAGCSAGYPPNTYYPGEVGSVSQVKHGIVISKRYVTIDSNSHVGGIAGAVAGGAAGSTIGGSASANIVGAVGGAVVGGLIGNSIDQSMNRYQGIEYMIRLRSGRVIAVVQEASAQFALHQPVMVLFGRRTRIVPDDKGFRYAEDMPPRHGHVVYHEEYRSQE